MNYWHNLSIILGVISFPCFLVFAIYILVKVGIWLEEKIGQGWAMLIVLVAVILPLVLILPIFMR